MFRLLKTSRVPWVLLENVPGKWEAPPISSSYGYGHMWLLMDILSWPLFFHLPSLSVSLVAPPIAPPPPLTRAAGLLDRIGGNPPAIAAIASELEKLGYAWAQRTVRVKRGGGGGGG